MTNELQGAWAGASVGLAVNLWISVSSILYSKSPLEDNLPVGTSCEAGNITTTLMPNSVTYGVIKETPEIKYSYLILRNSMRDYVCGRYDCIHAIDPKCVLNVNVLSIQMISCNVYDAYNHQLKLCLGNFNY